MKTTPILRIQERPQLKIIRIFSPKHILPEIFREGLSAGRAVLDENLKDFQLIGIEPDFVAGEAFIYWNDIVIAVRSEEHFVSAVRAIDLW